MIRAGTIAGEGYYLGHTLEHLAGVGIRAGGWGVDVSKLAVRLAAGRYGRSASFAVASSFRLPFDDQVHLYQACHPFFGPVHRN